MEKLLPVHTGIPQATHTEGRLSCWAGLQTEKQDLSCPGPAEGPTSKTDVPTDKKKTCCVTLAAVRPSTTAGDFTGTRWH